MSAAAHEGPLLQIRNRHEHGFRPSEWAELLGVNLVSRVGVEKRLCFIVRFQDGMTDDWPVYQSSSTLTVPYEFRKARPSLPGPELSLIAWCPDVGSMVTRSDDCCDNPAGHIPMVKTTSYRWEDEA